MKLHLLALAALLLSPSAQQTTGTTSRDARDILERMGPDFGAPRMGLPRPVQSKTTARELASDDSTDSVAATDRRRRIAASKVLEASLRRQLRLEEASAVDARWLRVNEEGVVSGSLDAAGQAQLEELLACLRGFDDLIVIEARYVELQRTVARKLGIEATSHIATTEERDVLLDALMAEGANMLSSPQVLMHSLQQATLYVGDVLTYVEDWSVHKVEPHGAEVLDPKIMEVRLGTSMAARGLPLPGDKLSLSLEIEHASVAKPLRTSRVQLGSREVEIALPEISAQRVRVELTVAPKATTLLPIPSEADKLLLVFVTADVVPETK